MSKILTSASRAVALALAAGAPLFGQCAMCRTAAAAQGAHAAHSFNKAILILLLPALMLFSGIFVLAFRFHSAEKSGRSGDRG
jgi:hypothetical protein